MKRKGTTLFLTKRLEFGGPGRVLRALLPWTLQATMVPALQTAVKAVWFSASHHTLPRSKVSNILG
jgi:hypothetical protein